jgi:hypothetical protein
VDEKEEGKNHGWRRGNRMRAIRLLMMKENK